MRYQQATRFCGVVVLSAILLWVPAVAQAEMLSTQKTLQSLSSPEQKREWFASMVQRRQVQEQLQEYGVSQKESLRRVNSMTDEEIATVIDQIEQYAGAGDPLWRASGEKDAGYIFTIIVGVLVIGCLAFCWIIFI